MPRSAVQLAMANATSVSIVLPAPPVIGERQTSTHDCGPAALAASLEWAKRSDTEQGIVSWMHAHGRDETETGPADFAAYCLAFHIPNSWDYGNVPMSQYIPAAVAKGHAVLGLHQCDGGANPVPVGRSKVAHWRTFYGATDATYPNMNPWPPSLDDTQISALAAADLRCHFEVLLTHPLAPPAPPEEPHMAKLGLFIAKDVQTGGNAVFVSDGMFFRHVPGPTPQVPNPEPDEAQAVGPWFNGDGLPLRLWNANPVADVKAFGTPANAETAALVGLPFP